MAFIFAHPISGFVDSTGAAKAGFQTTVFTAGSLTYPTTEGRFGGGGIKMEQSQTDLPLPAAASGKIIVQFSVKLEPDINPDEEGIGSPLLLFYNNNGADRVGTIVLHPNMAVGVLNADSSVPAGGTSGPGVFGTVAHHVVVAEMEIGSASGTVRVWVDDMITPKIDISGVDLDDGTTTDCDRLLFISEDHPGISLTSAGTWILSQLFVYDTSGAAPWNAPIGDKRMFPILPDGDDAQGWTRSAGANNFDLVDDPLNANSDDDSTYVEAQSASVLDQYTMEDLPVGTDNVISVIANVEARKTDAGPEHSALTVRLDHTASTTDVTLPALTNDYAEYQTPIDDVPGGSGWTATQVNATKAGPRLA